MCVNLLYIIGVRVPLAFLYLPCLIPYKEKDKRDKEDIKRTKKTKSCIKKTEWTNFKDIKDTF